jgi:hypothetical protein
MKRAIIVLAGILACGSMLVADVPQVISYQGYLKDDLGIPVADGDFSLTFAIYGTAEGGSALWTSGPQSVTVTEGLFEYNLGSAVPFPPYFFQNDTLR